MGSGYRHAVGSSQQAFFVAIALGVMSCSGSTRDVPSTLPEPDSEQTTNHLPGEPVLLELDTSSAHLVRLIETETAGETGRLQISSSAPGVVVSIDGAPHVPLPAVQEVGVGVHEVNAICPNSTNENLSVSVEAGATVHLRLCDQAIRP